MNKLLYEIEKKIRENKAIYNEASKYVSKKITGEIRISAKGNARQYYLRTEDICKKYKNGKYIKKSDRKVAYDIVQKDYCEDLLVAVHNQLDELEKLHEILKNDKVSLAYINQNEYRKEIITPILLPDKEYVEQWEKEEYKGKPFAESSPEIYTNKGERVRSKSEKIIADYLYSQNIPYKYEKPVNLFLKSGKLVTFYPDFTILDVANRREIYLEHLGRMDDPEYAVNAVSKIEIYELNGIFPGDRLFLTYETATKPLDNRIMQSIIHNALYEIG